ncbi:MAG: DM13 domain-containing protein [Chloroflexota bacterium]
MTLIGTLIGDLERLFATSIYPLRVPIAIAVVIGLIGLTVLARRRGWFAAARRHPGRTASLIVVALAIGLPVGWYLASPLFIRTELIEPAPVGAIGAATDTPPAASTPDESVSTVATGTILGADDFHFGEGTASIIETAPGRYALRFEDFSVQNGPDLYVYLSPAADGYTDGALELGTLKATDGAFGYELPEGTDPADFASVVIWCKQFAVLFAVAPLVAA